MKEKQEKRERPKQDWRQLLQEALDRPGVINEAYRLFHRFSLGNSLWAMSQIMARGIEPGPVASFMAWKQAGRMVRKGEKALTLWMPIVVGAKKDADADPDAAEGAEKTATRRIFVPRAHWFALAQTDPIPGVEQRQEPVDDVRFDVAAALAQLGFNTEPFANANGSVMGYSYPAEGRLAVSPLAFDPLKTLFHEMAHCILHKDLGGMLVEHSVPEAALHEVEAESTAYLVCCTLGHMGSIDSCRGYIQTWIQRGGQEGIPEKNVQRIFSAANRILAAGQMAEPQETEQPQAAAA